MKNNKITIEYDLESDVLTWEITKKAKIDYASEMGNIVVHFTKNHIPVLIEVLEASKIIPKSEQAVEKARGLAFAR
jgi:hypothetical protein